MKNSINEKELLDKISNGNIKAFEEIFFAYQPRLVYFLTGFIHDSEASNDMAQDVFLSLWKDRHKLSKVESFSSYLFTIARFKVYNYFDRLLVQNKYQKYHTQHLNTDITESHEDKIFAKELQSLVDKAVVQMPPQQQRVYRMSREEGLTNDTIAKKLGISKRTVENYITASLAVLRKVLFSWIFI